MITWICCWTNALFLIFAFVSISTITTACFSAVFILLLFTTIVVGISLFRIVTSYHTCPEAMKLSGNSCCLSLSMPTNSYFLWFISAPESDRSGNGNPRWTYFFATQVTESSAYVFSLPTQI